MAKKKAKSEPEKKKIQLNLDGLKAGMVIKDLHNVDVNVDDDLIAQMRRFEQETKQHAIWRGTVTGMFLRFKYIQDNPDFAEKKVKEVIEEELEEVIEKQVKQEEDELLDCMEDYKSKYHVKTVNTNTKKFKAFFEKWKQSD